MTKQGVAALVAVALMASSPLAVAQEAKIGVVVLERILRGFLRRQGGSAETRSRVLEADRELQDMGARLKSGAERFEKGRSGDDRDGPRASPARTGRARREFQRKQREFREDFNQRRNEELQSIIERTNRIIRQMAEQEKYDLIVQEAVYYNPPHRHHREGPAGPEQRSPLSAMAATSPSRWRAECRHRPRQRPGACRRPSRGPPTPRVEGLAPLAAAGATDLAFLANPRYRNDALTTAPRRSCCRPRAHGSCPPPASDCPCSLSSTSRTRGSPTPRSCCIPPSRCCRAWRPRRRSRHRHGWMRRRASSRRVHRRARHDRRRGRASERARVVGADAAVGSGSRLHPRAVVLDGCRLGERCIVASGAVIAARRLRLRAARRPLDQDPAGRRAS